MIFRCFRGKKTLNINSPHHMKPFNIKNNRFGGRIPHQQTFIFSKSESGNLISLLQPKKTEK
jgi:hypothetical protein